MSKTLNDSHMGYMETSPAPYMQIETKDGTEYVPRELFDSWASPSDMRKYVSSDIVDLILVEEGILWRMTAPGYLDSTDWTPAENEEEAEREAREMYCDDEDDDEDDEGGDEGGDDETYIEMTFPDGTVVQWSIVADSENEAKVEEALVSILGQPSTRL